MFLLLKYLPTKKNDSRIGYNNNKHDFYFDYVIHLIKIFFFFWKILSFLN